MRSSVLERFGSAEASAAGDDPARFGEVDGPGVGGEQLDEFRVRRGGGRRQREAELPVRRAQGGRQRQLRGVRQPGEDGARVDGHLGERSAFPPRNERDRVAYFEGAGDERAVECSREPRGQIAAVGRGGQHDMPGAAQQRGELLGPASRREGAGVPAPGGERGGQGGRGFRAPRSHEHDQPAGTDLPRDVGAAERQRTIAYRDHDDGASRAGTGGCAHSAHNAAPTRSPSITAACARRGASASPMRCTLMPSCPETAFSSR